MSEETIFEPEPTLQSELRESRAPAEEKPAEKDKEHASR